MKKIILLIACLLPLAGMAQTGFTIKGKVGSLNSPAMAYLSYTTGNKSMMDSAEIKNGKFQFKGKVQDPGSAGISIKHEQSATPKIRLKDVLPFYIENANMTITATDSIKNATIKGSIVNDENRELKALTQSVTDEMAAITKEFMAKTAAERLVEAYRKPAAARLQALKEQQKQINMDFIAAHRNSYLALMVFNIYGLAYNFDPKIAETEFNKFSAALKSTDAGKMAMNKIELAKKSQIGATAMDFTQNDVNDKPFTLSSLKGKYVLVDFWASWCAPCRAENPNVVKAYNELKGKNFEIVSISLDSSKKPWLNAIEKDGMPWIHVSDLKGWKNEVALKYGISAVPQNFLIDPNGMVIGKNLRGEELHEKLAQLIKD